MMSEGKRRVCVCVCVLGCACVCVCVCACVIGIDNAQPRDCGLQRSVLLLQSQQS